MSKVVGSLSDAIRISGLKDGMTISFHHCLRGGDTIATQIVRAISDLGIRDITLAPSALQTGMDSMVEFFENGTVTKLIVGGATKITGSAVQRGVLPKVSEYRTHGTRPRDVENGSIHIDVAFIAAPICDKYGNCNGTSGKSAFGSMGYAMLDARYADTVIVVTDNLVNHLVYPVSIDQSLVHYVCTVDSIGDPNGIASNTLQLTKDPVGLHIADVAVSVLKASGFLKDGMGMQTGAGGISLAVAQQLEDYMIEKQIHADFAMGGIHAALVRMKDKGLIDVLYDTQSFDLVAIDSLRKRGKHVEVSSSAYANPDAKGGPIVNNLDFVILGATEIDVDFNVNVHTGGTGKLISGAGGHGDTAEGATMTIITAPSYRKVFPTVVDKVNVVSTPGKCIDVFVSEAGVAVNTSLKKNEELAYRLKDAGINVIDIHDLRKLVAAKVDNPVPLPTTDEVVAKILWRDGTVLSELRKLKE